MMRIPSKSTVCTIFRHVDYGLFRGNLCLSSHVAPWHMAESCEPTKKKRCVYRKEHGEKRIHDFVSFVIKIALYGTVFFKENTSQRTSGHFSFSTCCKQSRSIRPPCLFAPPCFLGPGSTGWPPGPFLWRRPWRQAHGRG